MVRAAGEEAEREGSWHTHGQGLGVIGDGFDASHHGLLVGMFALTVATKEGSGSVLRFSLL